MSNKTREAAAKQFTFSFVKQLYLKGETKNNKHHYCKNKEITTKNFTANFFFTALQLMNGQGAYC